tara:strand:+ start:25312 stop:25761 length:450 start_codon:yes stop_codon:yes gene_type:complete
LVLQDVLPLQSAFALQDVLSLQLCFALQLVLPLQPWDALQLLFSVFFPQPAALQPFVPEPAKAGAAENAPTASIPANAAAASFLLIGFFTKVVVCIIYSSKNVKLVKNSTQLPKSYMIKSNLVTNFWTQNKNQRAKPLLPEVFTIFSTS